MNILIKEILTTSNSSSYSLAATATTTMTRNTHATLNKSRSLETFTSSKRTRSSLPDNNLNRPRFPLSKQRRLSTALSPYAPLFKTKALPASVKNFIEEKAALTNCYNIHFCDGSEEENESLLRQMHKQSIISPLKKYDNCWLARTDPRDVARVESKTFICTKNKYDTVPRSLPPADGKVDTTTGGQLGNWMAPEEAEKQLSERFKNCMTGRTMYVIPFSMGPLGSNLSKLGIQLTDSPYVVASMRIMTRVSRKVLDYINNDIEQDFVRCTHSVGRPLPLKENDPPIVNNWPCNPDKTLIVHFPEKKEIVSFGSGYGGNSLLGKKCLALRMGSILGQKEGWLAEHMLILGITNPQGVKKYIAAAFPSACGKTNLAMMTPTLPGFKVECVGDDIAWMRFDENGTLRAINPEAGFFGVAPGTNEQSNPNAMKTITRNTIFTNVAETSDGDFYWEGLEHRLDGNNDNNNHHNQQQQQIRTWLNETLDVKDIQQNKEKKAAHPNSRFCAPASQCPIIDPLWEDSEGVPISAIIFGGRRPQGVPLVYEAFDWEHGVFVGASMRSETTAAAEHTGKSIMHDPFAMRPFFGYNFGHYLKHWLNFGQQKNLKLPKIFHVNWFRKDEQNGQFLWPGFGDNSRVLDWICRRVDGENSAIKSPIGWLPKDGAINLSGLQHINLDELFSVPKEFWLNEQKQVDRYLKTNVGEDLPLRIIEESYNLKERLLKDNNK